MKAILLALLAGLATTPAYALYCNNKLVSEGDPETKVRIACGEPVHIHRYVIYEVQEYATVRRPYRPGYRETRDLHAVPFEIQTIVPIAIEEWTYNFGPERLLHRVIFQNGYLRQVQTSGYGF